MNDTAPIFIVGAPRSGTSLLRVILNRHPSIWLCDETRFAFRVYARRRAFGDLGVSTSRRRLVDRYLESQPARDLGLPLDALAEVLMLEGTSYEAFFTTLIRFGASEQHKPRFGEKTPGHALFTETLCKWYPDCKLIHIVRDPRDVVASLQRMPFGSECIASNTRTWLLHVSGADTSRHRKNHLLVRYEDLIQDPESELRRILAFVGEEYRSEILEADEFAKNNEWWFHRAQSPLQRGRVEKWREQLDAKQVAVIEWLTANKMDELGYRRESNGISITNLALALGHEYFDRLRTRVLHLPTLWYYWIQPTNLAAEDKAWARRVRSVARGGSDD